MLKKLFPKVIVDSVVLLTRKEGESYGQFIDRMCHNEEFDDSFYIARAVKIEDLNDNLDLSRLDKITDEDIDRIKKYMNAAWLSLLLLRISEKNKANIKNSIPVTASEKTMLKRA